MNKTKLFSALGAFAFLSLVLPAVASAYDFTNNPELVTIQGFPGTSLQDPFLSYDGKYLFWDTHSGDASIPTKIYYAERIDYKTFTFKGEVQGTSASPFSLEQTPSMDKDNNFYWVSDRSFAIDKRTIYHGTFANGAVSNAAVVLGTIATTTAGYRDIDVEVSYDGQRILYSEAYYQSGSSLPSVSKVKIASKNADGSFTPDSNSDAVMSNINTLGLIYAPSSSDGLELYFTLSNPLTNTLQLYVAKRTATNLAFGAPQLVTAANNLGRVEGTSVSRDSSRLYFHKINTPSDSKLYVITRPLPIAPVANANLNRWHLTTGTVTKWYLSSNPSEPLPGWTKDFAVGGVWATQVGGSIPLLHATCGNGDNLYTTSSTEMQNAIATGCTATPSPGFVAAPSDVDAGLVPLYRAYIPSTGQHFYTNTYSEIQTIPATYFFEGKIALLPPAVAGLAVAPITSTLARGSRGSEVSTLQQLLSKFDHFSAGITGYFGSITEASVKSFQKDHGLAAVGVVGPYTRALLNRLAGN